jgi:hypothetical protein
VGRIIGHGDIAKALKGTRPDLTFFASGVSNSAETRQLEFQREMSLLALQPATSHLVYFSSLAVFFSDTPYFKHKRAMETVVKYAFPKHTIVRIGNIDWGKNPHTLINYLRAHPDAELKDEYRYIVDKKEFLYWIRVIPDWPCEMNIIGRKLKVKDVYDKYVKQA